MSIVNSKPENDTYKDNYFIFCYAGEYLALTGDKLNGVEMIACRLATHYSLNAVCSSLLLFVLVTFCTVFVGQFSVSYIIWLLLKRLAWLEERLGKLVTDDPSIVEASLSQYADLVYPERDGILHK